MKIVKIKGGLGNQMFQYSFAKLIEKRTGDQVKIDFSAYQNTGKALRAPYLKRFSLTLDEAENSDLKNLLLFKHKGNPFSLPYKASVFAEKTLNSKYAFEEGLNYKDVTIYKGKNYFDGYWQSWKYIQEVNGEIQKDFVPQKPLSDKTLSFIAKIQNENSVFMGVRRGDYLKHQKTYGSFSSNYYKKAMAHITSKTESPIFYIFSDDIDWCKVNLDLGDFKVVYREAADQTDDFEELIAMTNFKHAIIVNSTFHWWAAWLIKNPAKIICRPNKWFFDNTPIDIIPPDWIPISDENDGN